MVLDLPSIGAEDVDGPMTYRAWDGPGDVSFVLLHGLGGSHLSWIQAAPGLAGLGPVLAVDMPGFGRSPRAGRPSRLMDQQRMLGRFLDARGIGRVVLAGNSMGGVVGLLEAVMEPDRVAGLILTSSVYPMLRGPLPNPLVLGAFAAYDVPRLGELVVKSRSAALDPESFVRVGLRILTSDPSTIPDEVVALHAEMIAELRADPEAEVSFLEAARSITSYVKSKDAGRRAMSNVRAPVLVIHGRNDRFVPVGYAEAVLAAYPSWRGRVFARVGHVPQMEATSRWLAEVADWYGAVLR
ncbi:MAG TPA: alpha/beta hydrolase [Actinomycetota bacterium]|jgi:pimeloyl-ACP methyl ester carboxylesterase|nr:alpha/beta hydrolase [Actinomycetota bacterium]